MTAAAAGPVCAHCGSALPARSTGRPARYCSQSCRQAAHRAGRRAQAARADADRIRPRLGREAALVGRLAEAVAAAAADPDSTGVEPAVLRLLDTVDRLVGLARSYRAAELTARDAGLFRRPGPSSPAGDETPQAQTGPQPPPTPEPQPHPAAQPPAEPTPPAAEPAPACDADQPTGGQPSAGRRIDFNGVHSPVAARLRAAGVYDSGGGITRITRRAGDRLTREHYTNTHTLGTDNPPCRPTPGQQN